MNYWIWAVFLVGILSTAVLWGADIFFLTVGRSALRLATTSAATEVMGFLHMFADARMPIWGAAAMLSNVTLLLFLNVYSRLSKPDNRLQTEAAKSGRNLDNGRELQAAWDRSLLIRVPLLVVSMLAPGPRVACRLAINPAGMSFVRCA